MNLPDPQQFYARQRGSASIAIAMLLAFIMVAAVTTVMKISGSSVMDSGKNDEQIAALFLAESGLERAQGTLRAAALTGTITDATCTALKTQSANLGRGSFTYMDAVSTPATCGGVNPACTKCDLAVKGNVGSSSRSITSQITAYRTDGVEGRTNAGNQTENLTPNFTLNLKTTQSNSATFTHLAYNPITNWGGDAVVGTCLNSSPGTSLTACIESWKVAGFYYNNAASQGVFAQVPTPGYYSITESLTDPLTASPLDTRRNYVMVGVTFNGLGGGAVSHVGSYTHQTPVNSSGHITNCNLTNANPRTQPVTAGDCNPYDYQGGYLPSTWTCNPNSGTTSNWSNAGNADTLVVGFGGKPYRTGTCFTGTPYQMSKISLNGQPLGRQVNMVGGQCDAMYSQIWYAYNRGYYPEVANATNIAIAAIFTGTVGASITGHTTNGAGRFVLDSNVSSNEIFSVGDHIRNTSGATDYGTIASLRSGTWGQSGSVYNLTGGSTISSTGTSLRAYSTVLRLFSAPSSGAMALNDIITDGGSPAYTTYGTLRTLLSGTLNAVGSTYRLTNPDGSALSAPLFVSSSTNNMRSRRTSTTITLSGATTQPAVGTALGVPSGTGQFLPDSVTGSISGTTLTVTAVTGSTNLSAGDALFGGFCISANVCYQIKPNTLITARGPGTIGGIGTYTISPSQTAASGTIIARAAVVTVASANSFTVSRLPDTTLSSAQLCGGLCPFLLSDGSTPVGRFNLTNINDYDDWAGGFSCLSGVDPNSIETVGTVVSKRSGWSELVQ